MRVLLLSPLAGMDPANGDVTYTEQLLAQPPAGVEYVDYRTAMAEGALVARAARSEVQTSVGLSRGSAVARAAAAKGLNRVRSAEVIFREPFRFLSVEQGVFDLVHSHVFSVGFRGKWPPIVVSNSVAVEALYRDGLGWSRQKVSLARNVERVLARGLRVDHSTYRMGRAARLVAFTEDLRRWWIAQGVAPESAIDVVPCVVEPRQLRPLKSDPRVIGFFAGAPAIKGLDRAAAVHRSLRGRGLDVELWVIGSDDAAGFEDVVSSPGVRWVGRRARSELLAEVLPQLDVLLHPTRFDGLPLSVLEAMSVGVPIVSSDYRALPEVVGDAGRAVPSVDEACVAVAELLQPEANAAFSQRAWWRQRNHFSPAAALPRLLATYMRAITGD